MNLHQKRILVTGASGFIGSALMRRLVGEGSEVHAVSRSPQVEAEEAITWWAGDCSDFGFVREVVTAARPDFVFHLAGYVFGTRDLNAVIPAFQGNLVSTVNLLTAAAETGCGRVVLAGSLEEPASEDGPAAPSSPYAASKWACDGYARMFHSLYGLRIVNPRIFMAYGPGRQPEKKLIPYLIRSYLRNERPALSSGERLVDWIFIEDLVDGLVACLDGGIEDGGRVDLGTGRLTSVRAIAEQLHGIVASGDPPRFGGLENRPMEQVRAANLEETAHAIPWRPRVPLEEGLKRTVEWYRAQDPVRR